MIGKDFRAELKEYLSGVFKDVYFCHEVVPISSNETLLRSTYFFDLDGFPLLSLFRFTERFPWMEEMVNFGATAILLRGFAENWRKR
jgi:hypothetical protein